MDTTELVKSIQHILSEQVSPDVMEQFAGILNGPTESLDPGNPLSTRVSTGIDAILGLLSSPIRHELENQTVLNSTQE